MWPCCPCPLALLSDCAPVACLERTVEGAARGEVQGDDAIRLILLTSAAAASACAVLTPIQVSAAI